LETVWKSHWNLNAERLVSVSTHYRYATPLRRDGVLEKFCGSQPVQKCFDDFAFSAWDMTERRLLLGELGWRGMAALAGFSRDSRK
jgi:hypothetical protein